MPAPRPGGCTITLGRVVVCLLTAYEGTKEGTKERRQLSPGRTKDAAAYMAYSENVNTYKSLRPLVSTREPNLLYGRHRSLNRDQFISLSNSKKEDGNSSKEEQEQEEQEEQEEEELINIHQLACFYPHFFSFGASIQMSACLPCGKLARRPVHSLSENMNEENLLLVIVLKLGTDAVRPRIKRGALSEETR